MKPYYESGGITIYHGDCREILPSVQGADLILADPPYGIRHVSGGATGGKWHRVKHQGVKIAGDGSPFDPTPLLTLGVPCILWGANFFSDKLPLAGWLVWDKRRGIEDMEFNRSAAELAFFSGSKTVKVFRHLWHGICRDSEVGQHLHPTQKPVALMAWCIGLVPAASRVLDPYCGSGPTLRAARDLGIQAIGIEVEERYCEIAARRLDQGVLGLGAA